MLDSGGQTRPLMTQPQGCRWPSEDWGYKNWGCKIFSPKIGGAKIKLGVQNVFTDFLVFHVEFDSLEPAFFILQI